MENHEIHLFMTSFYGLDQGLLGICLVSKPSKRGKKHVFSGILSYLCNVPRNACTSYTLIRRVAKTVIFVTFRAKMRKSGILKKNPQKSSIFWTSF